jgi:hypothetical protein
VLSRIKTLVKKERIAENRHTPTITNDFEQLYDEITDFEEHIRTSYPVIRTTRSVARAVWMRIVKIAQTVGGYVMAALLLAILASPVMPEGVKEYYHRTVKILFCKISSDPTCK